jgi:hypothetical protein
LPTGIATDDTTKQFFQEIIGKRSLSQLIGYENEAFIFPSVHHSFRFCALTLRPEGRSTAQEGSLFAFFCRHIEDSQDKRRHFRLSPSDFTLLNPNTGTCPVFRSGADAQLTKKIYQQLPVFTDEKTGRNPWGIQFATMFHMANDSNLFLTTPISGALPLYESKYFHQFDHRHATCDSATNVNVLPQPSSEDKAQSDFAIQPRYWVRENEVAAALPHWKRRWLLALRRLARSHDERTMISSVLPFAGVGDNAVLVFVESQYVALTPCLVALFDSLVFDYVVRQKMAGAAMSHFILRQLPTLPPSAFRIEDRLYITNRVLELVYTADDVAPFALDAGYEGPAFGWNDVRRGSLRADLDAYFAHLYGLTRDEIRYVLDPKDVFGEDFPSETFRVLKEREEKEYGEYRTRKLVLETFDLLAETPRFRDEISSRVSSLSTMTVTSEGR